MMWSKQTEDNRWFFFRLKSRQSSEDTSHILHIQTQAEVNTGPSTDTDYGSDAFRSHKGVGSVDKALLHEMDQKTKVPVTREIR